MPRARRLGPGFAACTLLSGSLLMGSAGPAAAKDFGVKVEKNVCTLAGGKYGYGYARLVVRATEYGSSGADYIRQIADGETEGWPYGPATSRRSSACACGSSSGTSAQVPTSYWAQSRDIRSGADG